MLYRWYKFLQVLVKFAKSFELYTTEIQYVYANLLF